MKYGGAKLWLRGGAAMAVVVSLGIGWQATGGGDPAEALSIPSSPVPLDDAKPGHAPAPPSSVVADHADVSQPPPATPVAGLVPAPSCAGGLAVAGDSTGLCVHEASDVGHYGPPPAAAAPPPVPPAERCRRYVGDANRVEMLYVRTADVPSRIGHLVDLAGQVASEVDAVFAESAAKTGGSRAVRWQVDGNCDVVVADVVVSAASARDFSQMVRDLKDQGFGRADRKYLIFFDAEVLCGVGTVYVDDQPGPGNLNNGKFPQYARVDAPCWRSDIAAHELMHTLGAVQPSAPHGTPGLHCTDEADLMCTPGHGAAERCGGPALFDCGNDDYFSTAPPPGSYLASRWNTASSAFLYDPTASPDLEIRTAAPEEVLAGQQFDQQVAVENLGSLAADRLTITHRLDDRMKFVGADLAGHPVDCVFPQAGSTGTIKCELARLAPGASLQFVIRVEVGAFVEDGYQAVTDSAVDHQTHVADPRPENNRAHAVTSVTGVVQPDRGLDPLGG